MKINKITLLMVLLFLPVTLLAGPSKIISISYIPANPSYGDLVRVTVQVCEEAFGDARLTLAISTTSTAQPASTGGQVFVVDAMGIDRKDVTFFNFGIDLGYHLSNNGGAPPAGQCSDCGAADGWLFTYSYDVHLPTADYFSGVCNPASFYLIAGIRDYSFNASDWSALGACSNGDLKSLAIPMVVPPPSNKLAARYEGSLTAAGDEVLYAVDYSYGGSGAFSISDPVPGGGDFTIMSFGPTMIPGGSVSGPVIGQTAGTYVWSFPARGAQAGMQSGTIWMLLKLNTYTAGKTYTNTATATQPGTTPNPNVVAASVVSGAPAISITKTESVGSLFNGQTITYVLSYDVNGYAMKSFQPVDNIAAGAYNSGTGAPAGWKFYPYNGDAGTWTVHDPCNTGGLYITGSGNPTTYPGLLLDDGGAHVADQFCTGMITTDFYIEDSSYTGADALINIRANGLTGTANREIGLTVSIDQNPASEFLIVCGGTTPAPFCGAVGPAGSFTNTPSVGMISSKKWYRARIMVTPSGTGQRVQTRIWGRGDPEPGIWDIDYTIPNVGTGGAADWDCVTGTTTDWRPGINQQSGDGASVMDSYDNFTTYLPRVTAATTQVYDTVPTGVTYVGNAGGCLMAAGVVNCPIGSVSLTSGSFTWWGTVSGACGSTISNQAMIDYASGNAAPIGSNWVDAEVYCWTPTFTPTNTPIMPTSTLTRTGVPSQTFTATFTPSRSPTPVFASPTPTRTACGCTPSFTPTVTSSLTVTQTLSATLTPPFSTSTFTSTRTPTPSFTRTRTPTVTFTATPTFTNIIGTAVPSSTATLTFTASLTQTYIPTFMPTSGPTPCFILKWGTTGTGSGQFDGAFGIATDNSGNVYVADTYNDRIQKFNSSGTYITEWGGFGTGNGQMDYPFGVAVDNSGNVYVADTNNNRIQKFSNTGAYITQWGGLGTGIGQFDYPFAIAVDNSGYVYVSDANNDRIEKFSSTGAYITQWGSTGTGPGQFTLPDGVAVDNSGNVYVVEDLNNRVQKFSDTGAYITQWGSAGSGSGQFDAPYGVAVDGSGNVYVTEMNNNRIQEFSGAGSYITQWGSLGTGDGQFDQIFGVAVDTSGNIYASDASLNRIQKFGSCFPTPTPTPAGFYPGNIVWSGMPGNDKGSSSCTDALGNIYVVGLEWDGPCSCYVIYIYKYLPDGTMDFTFGTGGRMKCPGPDMHYAWNDRITIKCDLSGRLVIGAYTDSCGGTCADMIIYRCTTGGVVDLTFNFTGYKICHNITWTGQSYGYCLDFDSTGKIVCTGKAWDGTKYCMITIKCNDDGSTDTTFGTGGTVTYCSPAGECSGTSIKCHGGKIYITGYVDVFEVSCSCVCREMYIWCYNEDGSVDTTFGTGGCCKYVNVSLNHKHCVPRCITITVGGKIVVTGEIDDGTGCTVICQSMVIWVFNSDGTPDTTFNTIGMVIDNGGGAGACGEQVLVDTDGKIIVIGTRHNGANTDICIWKYLIDGSIDTTFGTNGRMIYDSGNDEEGLSILKITICRLIATGYTYRGPVDQFDRILWNIEDMCPAHTVTVTPTFTPTITVTPTLTLTCACIPSYTVTPTAPQTQTFTATATVTTTATSTSTVTNTPTYTLTRTPTAPDTQTFTPTFTATATATVTSTPQCATGTPQFTVHLVYNPEHLDYVVMEITSSNPLAAPPTLVISAHGTCEKKPVFHVTATAEPLDATGTLFRYLYPKQTGWGDIDTVVVSGMDICGNSGTSSGDYTKETISKKDVILYKNVINPEDGERCRIVFNAYGNGNATVKIYSKNGTLIKTLFNGMVLKGNQPEVIWDGTNDAGQKVVSGIYVVAVDTDFYKALDKIAVVH